MEYQKINLLDSTPTSKFRTKNWVKIYDNSRGMDNTKSKVNLGLQC